MIETQALLTPSWLPQCLLLCSVSVIFFLFPHRWPQSLASLGIARQIALAPLWHLCLGGGGIEWLPLRNAALGSSSCHRNRNSYQGQEPKIAGRHSYRIKDLVPKATPFPVETVQLQCWGCAGLKSSSENWRVEVNTSFHIFLPAATAGQETHSIPTDSIQ